MPSKIGAFWELVVNAAAVNANYPGGVSALIEKMGVGEDCGDLVVWGSMGFTPLFDEIKDELRSHGLECDNKKLDCVYVHTLLNKPPKMVRNWLGSFIGPKGELWLYALGTSRVLGLNCHAKVSLGRG